MEDVGTRLARLEEGMVSVKGDTRWLRDNFHEFTVTMSAKAAGQSARISLVVSLVVGVLVGVVVHRLT